MRYFYVLLFVVSLVIGGITLSHIVLKDATTFVYKDNILVRDDGRTDSANFFLYNNWLGRILRPILASRFINSIFGLYNDSWLSSYAINSFIKRNNIKISDFVVPDNGFTSFNHFFTRELRPGARQIDMHENVLVAPADSNLYVIPELQSDTRFYLKSKDFSINTFLQDDALAKEFAGGTLLVFRLTPKHYHRYHFPCDAIPSAPIRLSGVLNSVQPMVFKAGYVPLQENERQLVVLQSEKFGKCVVAVIGAMFVGRIKQTYIVGKNCKKGDEMGYFAFGGSTVAVLLQKNIFIPDYKFIKHSQDGFETVINMGERVGGLK